LLTPPQAAAVVAGAVRSAAVVRDDAVVAGQVLTLSLTCDHRILYGARAAGFLEAIVSRVERPRP
jgi:pyruvate dehydrogenase E2 component (dihydrolipoamide acetyltransferase)